MRRNGRWAGHVGGVSLGLLTLLGGSSWARPTAESLIIVRAGTTHSVPVQRHRGYPAAPAVLLAEALGYRWVEGAIQMEGERIHFTEESPFFIVGIDVFQLANPVYRWRGGLMIPVSWALDWLPRAQVRSWRYLDGRLVERPPAAVGTPERGRPWSVVIDPGHGGEDPGTVGVLGTKEKEVTLAIGRRLAQRLAREPGIQVILTRDRDTLIDLSDRPRFAQRGGNGVTADLFLSIHGNSMPRKPNSTQGFETYFLALAKTEEARRVALRENASLRFEADRPLEDLDPLQFMLSDLQSTANLRESRRFATYINLSMGAVLSTPDRGVRQGPFKVLVGATMPAVLVEVGYLSNRSEEKRLRSPSYQAKIADALADAVVNYLAEYGRRIWSSYGSGG